MKTPPTPLNRRTKVDQLYALWFICLIDQFPKSINGYFLTKNFPPEVYDLYTLYLPFLEQYKYVEWEYFSGLPVVTQKGKDVADNWIKIRDRILNLH